MLLINILQWTRFLLEHRVMIYVVGMMLTLVLSYVFDMAVSRSNVSGEYPRSIRTHRIPIPKPGDRVYIYNTNIERYGHVEIIHAQVVAVTRQGTMFTLSEQNTEERYVYELPISDLISFANVVLFILRDPKPRKYDVVCIHPTVFNRLKQNMYKTTRSVSDFIPATPDCTTSNPDEVSPAESTVVHNIRLELTDVLNSQHLVLESSHDQFLIHLSMVKYCSKRGFMVS